MINKVYLAAPWPLRGAAREVREELNSAGIAVTSKWLDVAHTDQAVNAVMDIGDIRDADAVVLINPSGYRNIGTGGRHYECGYAAAIGMPLFILGNKSQVFHELPDTFVSDDLTTLIHALLSAHHVAFIDSHTYLSELVTLVHKANARWWKDPATQKPIARNVGEMLMLVTSELAEALEGHRKNLKDDKLPHFDMFTVEIADALIRLFDIAGGMGLPLANAFVEKMAFNAQREDHTDAHRLGAHGKKY